MGNLFYKVTTKEEPYEEIAEQQFFAKYDNAYAFQNKEARKWLKHHPERIKECKNEKSNDGCRLRNVSVYDNNTAEVFVNIELEEIRFSDELVEKHAQDIGIRKSDFPKKKAS